MVANCNSDCGQYFCSRLTSIAEIAMYIVADLLLVFLMLMLCLYVCLCCGMVRLHLMLSKSVRYCKFLTRENIFSCSKYQVSLLLEYRRHFKTQNRRQKSNPSSNIHGYCNRFLFQRDCKVAARVMMRKKMNSLKKIPRHSPSPDTPFKEWPLATIRTVLIEQ